MTARIGNRLGGTVAVALGALVLAGTASAQISVGGAPLKPQNAATGSIPPANQPAHPGLVPRAMVQAPPPAPGTPAPPWSGEDGASGHPLDDRERDPRGGGEFRDLRRRDVDAMPRGETSPAPISSALPRACNPTCASWT